ncbi:MAG: sporulation transcription factor Spo0A [Clostridiales bacterium]|nr:sporulation transcription factor Spo0A [Clostridiales bacterium]
MENKKIVLLDSNDNDRMELSNRLKEEKDIEVQKCFADAKEAMDYILNNDVDLVITDMLLQNSDGFALLEGLREHGIDTKVIVLSAISGDAFVQKALLLGADYYMLKPYKYEVLISRIQDVLSKGEEDKPQKNLSKIKNLDGRLSNIFITVGIPAHIKGYQFLREAIKMAIESPDIINSITKKLYPSIAKKFDTTSSKVERAIRHAIEVAWNRGKIENINNLFGVKVYSDNEKPTNGEFIALVADKMLIEGA